MLGQVSNPSKNLPRRPSTIFATIFQACLRLMLVVLILDAHAQLLQLLQHQRSMYLGLTAAMCIATSLAAASSVEPSRTVRTPMRPPMCR